MTEISEAYLNGETDERNRIIKIIDKLLQRQEIAIKELVLSARMYEEERQEVSYRMLKLLKMEIQK